MVGIYNPLSTQRLNGLSESVKQEHSGRDKGNAPQSIKVTIAEPLSDDEEINFIY
jgi:hypothetical protein